MDEENETPGAILDLAHADIGDPPDYEENDGVLVERHSGAESSGVVGELMGMLVLHCRQHRLGRGLTSEATYRCFASAGKTRKPDVSFIRYSRLEDGVLPKGELKIVPDLAAEVTSPNDKYDEVEAKVADYLSVKVPLIWFICPPTQTVTIWRPGGTARHLGPDDELDGENIIPGFKVRVADLFPPPPPEFAKKPPASE